MRNVKYHFAQKTNHYNYLPFMYNLISDDKYKNILG